MQRPLRLGAVAGSVAASGFYGINRAFDEVPRLENIAYLAGIVLGQLIQDLPLAAGLIGQSGGVRLAFSLFGCSHKE